MADRIIQTETLQSIANALRGGESQGDDDKIQVSDFAEVAEGLKEVNDSFVGFLNKNATSITIPEGVTSIGNQAFYNFTSISEINFPSTLISIGNGAFVNCTNLASITIPEGVTSIDQMAFLNCTSISEINLPSTLISIGGGAFNSCTSLTSITIPEGVTSIGDNAFRGCSSLTSILIPKGVTSIGANAFTEINANAVINCAFAEGAVSGEPWGAPDTVTINYDVNN